MDGVEVKLELLSDSITRLDGVVDKMSDQHHQSELVFNNIANSISLLNDAQHKCQQERIKNTSHIAAEIIRERQRNAFRRTLTGGLWAICLIVIGAMVGAYFNEPPTITHQPPIVRSE